MSIDGQLNEESLSWLADQAEANLHPDYDGRRKASQAVLENVVRVLTIAQQFDPSAYSTSVQPDGSVLVAETVRLRIGRRGEIRFTTPNSFGARRPVPGLRYDARRRVWEHADRPGSSSPVQAVLEVAVPIIMEAARQKRGVRPDPHLTRMPESVSEPHRNKMLNLSPLVTDNRRRSAEPNASGSRPSMPSKR